MTSPPSTHEPVRAKLVRRAREDFSAIGDCVVIALASLLCDMGQDANEMFSGHRREGRIIEDVRLVCNA